MLGLFLDSFVDPVWQQHVMIMLLSFFWQTTCESGDHLFKAKPSLYSLSSIVSGPIKSTSTLQWLEIPKRIIIKKKYFTRCRVGTHTITIIWKQSISAFHIWSSGVETLTPIWSAFTWKVEEKMGGRSSVIFERSMDGTLILLLILWIYPDYQILLTHHGFPNPFARGDRRNVRK